MVSKCRLSVILISARAKPQTLFAFCVKACSLCNVNRHINSSSTSFLKTTFLQMFVCCNHCFTAHLLQVAKRQYSTEYSLVLSCSLPFYFPCFSGDFLRYVDLEDISEAVLISHDSLYPAITMLKEKRPNIKVTIAAVMLVKLQLTKRKNTRT